MGAVTGPSGMQALHISPNAAAGHLHSTQTEVMAELDTACVGTITAANHCHLLWW